MARLIDFCADSLDLDIAYEPSLVAFDITLRHGEDGVAPAKLWQQLNAVLVTRQLVTVRRDDERAFEIVRMQDAARRTRVVRRADRVPPFPGFESVFVESRVFDQEQLLGICQSFDSGNTGASVKPVTGTEAIILTDVSPSIEQTLDFLDGLEADAASNVRVSIEVPRGAAERVASAVTVQAADESAATGTRRRGVTIAGSSTSTVTVLAPEADVAYWRSAIGEAVAAMGSSSRTYRVPGLPPEGLGELFGRALGAAQSSQDEFRYFANPLTGDLVVYADESSHQLLETLAQDLRSVPESDRVRTEMIGLKYRRATDIADRIDEINGREGLAQSVSERSSLADPATLDAVTQDTPIDAGTREIASSAGQRSRVHLVVDEESNVILVTGTPAEIESLAGLVAALDKPLPQVTLEVLLLSLTESETLDLGIELSRIDSSGGTTFRLSSLFGLGLGAGSTALPGAGAGLTGVVLDPGEFSALVQALETINEGRTLSVPKILVGNNQSGTFNSVLQQPIVSLNASDVVATTSFGGFEDAGTTITVEPQILAGDQLNLIYTVSLSSFVGDSSDPSIPPPRQQNQLSSSITIPDGYTIATGGIELNSDGESESRIPLLGQIPILGELFKTRSKTNSRTRFYVFIRANVYRDPMLERLRYASETQLGELSLPSGWPEIEPRVIR